MNLSLFLRDYKKSDNSPWFLDYWIVTDQIIQITTDYNKPRAPRKCGINVIARENETLASIVVETSSPFSSLKFESIGDSSFDYKQEEEMQASQVVGCCHDSVIVIANKLFENQNLKSLFSLKMNEKEIEKWKNKVTQQVSLECMKDAMEEREIRMRISTFIQNKLFDL
jgi:hypothetical protein